MNILDINYRKQIIKEIEGDENKARKAEMKKRYDIFKDGSKEYVIKQLSKELEPDTVKEMIARTPNLSFLKKIINKKAMVFKDGFSFDLLTESGEKQTELEEKITKILDFVKMGSVSKKINQFSELFKNTVAYVMPVKHFTGKWYYKVKVLQPYLYDAIEDESDPELAKCFIFSYYDNGSSELTTNAYGERSGGMVGSYRTGDGINQKIADSANDAGKEKKKYIWWTNDNHFTTDEAGEIEGESIDNEIKAQTLINFAQDQDGQFWAVGGDDLVEGAVTLNQLLADLFFVAKLQGNGLFYFFGKGVPKSVRIGPNFALTHEVSDKDEPEPKAGFLTSNPPLLEHMTLIEKFLTMLLSTNELEAETIDLGNDAQSGIHEAIKKSANVSDIENQRELYATNVPEVLKVLILWHNKLFDKGMLIPELEKIGKIPIERLNISLKFGEAPQFVTEKDRLDIIEKRKDMGLDSSIDSIMKDNPQLSRQDAEKRFLQMLDDEIKFSRKKLLGIDIEPPEEETEEETEDQDEVDGQE
jgi:hypothetical protein